jgi:hypothetical protein
LNKKCGPSRKEETGFESTMADILPSYPPSLPPRELSFLMSSLTDYCLSHGVTVRPSVPSENNHLASHAPVTVFPSLFPRNAWEQALKVQTIYNLLYARIANDVEWLGKIMDELLVYGKPSDCRLIDVDDFVRNLWYLYKEVREEGISQVTFKFDSLYRWLGPFPGTVSFRLYDSRRTLRIIVNTRN